MKQSWKCLWVFTLIASVTTVQAQSGGGFFDRLGDRLGKKVEDSLGGTSDKAVDKVFDKANNGVDCVAGDKDCTQSASATGAEPAKPAAAPSTAKCVATDVTCLKEAQAHGQTVELVPEEQVDVFHCSASDTACLQRAQKLGKKVQITD